MSTPSSEGTGSGLSLVIPAWNERETIQQAIREARTALAGTVGEYEIIVVDDGSTDGTAELVREEAAADPHVRLVQHPRNLGYGAALRTGFQAATRELVAFTDADCQFDLKQLAYLLPLCRHYDIACGCRIDRQDPAGRRFLSWGYNTLAAWLLGTRVHDVDCALKIFHREQLAAILPECDNFFVNTEMLTRARLQGLSVVEVGVHHRPRAAGQSKVSLFDVPKTLAVLLPFWWTRVMFPASRERKRPEHVDRRFGLGFAALLGLAAALLFLNLSYPFIEPDEGRYAEIGREMLASGDWIVPMLNGRPYFDKPPLFYWLLAGSYRVFGMSAWAARLVPALAAFFTMLGTCWFGTRMIGARGALLSGFALTLMAGFLHCGRFLVLDSVLTLFVSMSFFTAYEAIRGNRLHWPWWVASSVCCALGVLTKGPIALVLLAPPVAAYAWLSRNCVRPTLVQWCVYVGLLLALVAPWFIAISVHRPEFVREFFVEHHVKRFFSDQYHDNPIWFYVPVLLAGCMPWSLLLLPFTQFFLSRSDAIRGLRRPIMGFFLLWAGWCVLFFSFSRGKLPPYVLPAIPGIALLLGCYLEHLLAPNSPAVFGRLAVVRVPRWTILVLSGTCLLLALFARFTGMTDPARPVLTLVVAGVCLAVLIGTGFWGRRLPARVAWSLCGGAAVGFVLYTTQHFVPAWSCQRCLLNQPEELAQLLQDPDTAVACCEGAGSVSFSLNRGNARNFDWHYSTELHEFLRSHGRTLLIVPQWAHPAIVRWFVPGDAKIVREIAGRNARFVLVSGSP